MISVLCAVIKKDGSRDTFVVGTRGTAAPEQYGYTQTDQRTDVYANRTDNAVYGFREL